jgi:hypothetical protein|tara:strand:- start:638 stop:817 length:180 start_codon:yes stop_codon:yes gene_type:complete
MEGVVGSMRNMIERAGWTFVQAFLAVFVIGDQATLKVALIGAVAAALSVVKTYAVERKG